MSTPELLRYLYALYQHRLFREGHGVVAIDAVEEALAREKLDVVDVTTLHGGVCEHCDLVSVNLDTCEVCGKPLEGFVTAGYDPFQSVPKLTYQNAPITFLSDDSPLPCCDICGRLPATVHEARKAVETGGCAGLAPYCVQWEEPSGNVLHVGWVCAHRVHGNVPNAEEEGERLRAMGADAFKPDDQATDRADLIDLLRWAAQSVHQAYHTAHPGTWRECSKNVCASIYFRLQEIGAEPAAPKAAQ